MLCDKLQEEDQEECCREKPKQERLKVLPTL